MFVFAHPFPDISVKSTKLHYQSWEKFSPTISLLRRVRLELATSWFESYGHLNICYSGREYIDMNVNKHENWTSLEPANFELSELYHRDVQSLNCLAQVNFNT